MRWDSNTPSTSAGDHPALARPARAHAPGQEHADGHAVAERPEPAALGPPAATPPRGPPGRPSHGRRRRAGSRSRTRSRRAASVPRRTAPPGRCGIPTGVSRIGSPHVQFAKKLARRTALRRAEGSVPGPSSRLPTTMVRRTRPAAASSTGIDAASCWPSPSSVIIDATPRRRAAAMPVSSAWALPRRRGWRSTSAPAASATSALPSREPSSTTTTGACSARRLDHARDRPRLVDDGDDDDGVHGCDVAHPITSAT